MYRGRRGNRGEFIDSAIDKIPECISLSTEQTNSLYGSLFANKLRNYLTDEENNCIPEAKDFGELAVETRMAKGEVDFEEQVINNLTEDAKCTYKNLNEKGNDFVKNMLNKFDGESKLSLELTSKDKVYYTDKNGVTREVAGKTRSPVNNSILISINSSMANGTSSLGLARDLLHEIIHADMFRKLENTNSTGTIEDVDFNDTYNKYKAEHFNASPDHETMADLYIDAMSTTLKEFHKTVLINDYNKYVQHYGEEPPKEFYETFAWDGLRNQAGAMGCTDARTIDTDGNVTIFIIDQNVAYLEMAKNLIHEGIHAELYKFVHNYDGVLDPNDRKSVMGLYLFYKGVAEQGFMDSGIVASVYQHEYMAEKYVTPIAKAIRELDSNRFDLSYYMWYGWEGLEKTYQFKTRLTEAQKTNYINKKSQVNATTSVNCN